MRQPIRSSSRSGPLLAAAAAFVGSYSGSTAFAAQFATTKVADTIVDSRGMTLQNGAPYGRGINGNSFEQDTVTTFNGYQYTAYWVRSSPTGSTYYIAVARRPVGSTTWQVADLTNSAFVNGKSGTAPNDAHNVVTLGIDRTDGTIHLAYDMHGNTLRYRMSATGVATNPGGVTWGQSLFGAETSQLTSGTTVTGVTYPSFVRTPNNDLQFAYRQGTSGDGSWFIYDYSGAAHAWTNGHQIDDGRVGTYNGTTSTNSATRNNYPNALTYGPDGKLHLTFTWREQATGAANHDINYVYSEDGGNTWKNNAGTVVGDKAAGTKFSLTSPGLVVRPLAESQTLMNQQTQAVDSAGRIHTVMWHRDSAKTAAPDGVWDPQESSYFHYFRDNLGNWHQSEIPGVVGQRPKLFFDSNDNAYAIYQVNQGSTPLSSGNIYVLNGDLVIAAATKESNWTDWKVIHTESGPFVTEAQADGEMFKLNGTLSVMMQQSPTTNLQRTNIRALDYTFAVASGAVGTFSSSKGNWNTGGDWIGSTIPSGNAVAHVNGGRTATLDAPAAAIDGSVFVGSGGGAGTLNVAPGASLDIGASIIVGRDGGAVGSYNQTGGNVSSARFVVGDYFTETSGGGTSNATVSGGTLTTGELRIGHSANGSSNGSSFTVAGNGQVVVNGEVTIAEYGSSASLVLAGGTMTVAGDVVEGFNKVNTGTLRFDGGTLDMTANSISIDNLVLNSGRLMNVGGVNNGAAIVKNTAGVMSFAGSNTFANALTIQTGSIRAESNTALGATSGTTTITGGTATGRLELSGNLTIAEPITIEARSAEVAHVVNVAGNNLLTGTITTAMGGNRYVFQSDQGKLTVASAFAWLSGNNRALVLQGDGGEGEFASAITQTTPVIKNGAGTWTISSTGNTYTGGTTVNGGTLIAKKLSNGTLAINVGTAQLTAKPQANDPSGTTVLPALVIAGATSAPAGAFDVSNNSAIVGSATPKATIEGLIAHARDGGAWDSTGVTSSAAAAQSAHATGLGVLTGAEYSSVGGTGTLAGAAYGATDTLIKYTWNGDANFSGTVSFDDYVKIDTGFNSALTGWLNGDFNYDGVVNFDDYVLIDIAFNAQNGTLGRAVDWIAGDDRSGSGRTATGVTTLIQHFEHFGANYGAAFLAAVPEPGAVVATSSASVALLARRCRRKR